MTVEFQKHWDESIHSKAQFVNWVDVWLFDQGYRIILSGGIVPERNWHKTGSGVVNVRNREVQFQGRIPQTESELIKFL